MPSFPLSCLAYLSVAVPGSTLGLLWAADAAELASAGGMVVFGVCTGGSAAVPAKRGDRDRTRH